MKQKEMLRKAAWVAFGLVLAIEVTAIAGESAQEAKTTYAQGQYVHTLGGAESPFSDRHAVRRRGEQSWEFFQHHQRTN